VADKRDFLGRQERYLKIIEQAGEQSGNVHLPSLRLAEGLESLLPSISSHNPLFFAHSEKPKEKLLWRRVFLERKVSACSLLIGPEGGLSPKEVALLEQAGGEKVFFPTYVLRASSASLYLMSCIKSVHEEG
jgi:16S rRNA (uracil1498-N3)-methyltransferase